MIKVHYNFSDNDSLFFEIKGHAQSAEKGKDLVCAGVSSIVVGGLNAFKNPAAFDIKMLEGHVKVVANQKICEYDKIVLETMITQLQTIAESYPQYLKFIK